MSVEWKTRPLSSLLGAAFAGEWGVEPPSVANVFALRSTNLGDDGSVDYLTAAPRLVPPSKLSSKRLLRGDILLEASGGSPTKPVGRVGFFAPPDGRTYIVSNFFKTLRPNADVDARFLFWQLIRNYQLPEIWRYQQQTTGLVNLKFGEFREQNIRVPPLPEQRRIAAILDTLDRTIEGTQRVIEKLQATRQGLLHDLLTRGLDENGQLRDPERTPEQFKETELGRVPRAWSVLQVADCVPLESGQHIAAEFCNMRGVGTPYYTGPADFDGDATVVTRYTTKPKVLCRKGDILITVKGSGCGKVAVASTDACISRQLMSIRPNSSDTTFWLTYFKSKETFLNELSDGSAIPGLSRRQILSLPVTLPPPQERNAISRLLHGFTTRLDSEHARLAKLQALKRGLMEDLLTGRVRVAVADADVTTKEVHV